jgi:hypothetical protein
MERECVDGVLAAGRVESATPAEVLRERELIKTNQRQGSASGPAQRLFVGRLG